MKISQHQQRKKERRQHARGIRILQARKERGGGVAPRRHNRITESVTKESRQAKVKAKKAVQESNGKTTRRKDKKERKRNKEWDTENDKKEREKKEEKKKRKKGKIKENGKGVREVLR